MDPQILTFIAVVSLLTITPGADTVLVLRNVVSAGRSSGVAATLGISSGLFVHATLSALGLSVILVRSAAAYEIVKTVGAVYLIYLGLRSLYQVVHHSPRVQTLGDSDLPSGNKPLKKSYMEGFLTNVLNPKVAIFYLAFLPQFIRADDPVLFKSLLLAAIHAFLSLIWMGSLSLILHQGRNLIQTSSFRQWLEGVSGIVLVGLGVRLILEKR